MFHKNEINQKILQLDNGYGDRNVLLATIKYYELLQTLPLASNLLSKNSMFARMPLTFSFARSELPINQT